MQKCTVAFLICQETHEVLLIKKDRTDFAGRYNGVGGKVNEGESYYEAAVREIHEETGAEVGDRLVYLGNTVLPEDCATHDPAGVTLSFYTANVEKSEVAQQPGETEQLKWIPIIDVLDTPVTSKVYAGMGDLQYFLNLAVNGYK